MLQGVVLSDSFVLSEQPFQNSESVVKDDLGMEAQRRVSVHFFQIDDDSVEGVNLKVRTVDGSP